MAAYFSTKIVSFDTGLAVSGTPHNCIRGTNYVPEYRLFHLSFGHIRGPAAIFNCDIDQEAIEKAKQMANGHDVEVWQGARRVIEIKKI
jgi:hypothetical protein